jgi:hypothetical protein
MDVGVVDVGVMDLPCGMSVQQSRSTEPSHLPLRAVT